MKTSENMAVYMAERREKRRKELIALSGGGCEICGSINELEFNHKNRSEKKFGLDKRGMDYSWAKILDEWAKCELLCRTHHIEKTKEQYQNGEMPDSWNSKKHIPHSHGTMRMYNEQSCRCQHCKIAKKEYRNKKATYSQVVDIPRG